MKTVRVDLGERSYPIIIGSGILEGVGERVRDLGLSPALAVISNPTVFSLYGGRTVRSLAKAGFDVHEIIIPDGEQYKDFMWVDYILGEMLKRKLDRKSAVVALGGGVIGDIACFAASIYMRGIPCIQVPTTLLAQVDSSVGGKTGVNHLLGKNMIGTFHQPSLVWIDIDTLKTLHERELRAGMAEVIKYGIIRDQELFDSLVTHKEELTTLDPERVTLIIRRSCEIKAKVVSEDERESGVRAILNFGHTMGHAVETLTGYTRYLHGEAVAIGMCHAAELGRIVGLIDRKTVDRICDVIRMYHLPTSIPDELDPALMLKAMELDKKAVSRTIRFVLPEKIGSVRIVKDIREEQILQALGFRA